MEPSLKRASYDNSIVLSKFININGPPSLKLVSHIHTSIALAMPSVMAFMMNVLSTQPLRFNTTSPTPTPMLRSMLDFQEDTTVSVPQSVCGDDPSAIGATDGNDAAPIPLMLVARVMAS